MQFGGDETIKKDSKQLSQLQRDKLAAKENRYQSKRFVIRPRGYKTFRCSTQLSMKFIMHIHVKMLTFLSLSFISMINKTKQEISSLFQHFSCFYEH